MFTCLLIDNLNRHWYYAGVDDDGNALCTLNRNEACSFVAYDFPEVCRQMIARKNASVHYMEFRKISPR